MNEFFLITGNPHKLLELKAVFPKDLELQSKKLDLDEIQSLNLHEIVRYKLHQAYKEIQAPVIVEDVSAELEKLNGLPGPFVKFFEERLGRGALYKLAGGESQVKVVCAMGFFDGDNEVIVDGVLDGKIVAPREGEGFGFDFVLVPEGYDKTFSEMGSTVKNSISHRKKASQLLVAALQDKGLLPK